MRKDSPSSIALGEEGKDVFISLARRGGLYGQSGNNKVLARKERQLEKEGGVLT